MSNNTLDNDILLNFIYLNQIFNLPIPYTYDNENKLVLNQKFEMLKKLYITKLKEPTPDNDKNVIIYGIGLFRYITNLNKTCENKTPIYEDFRNKYQQLKFKIDGIVEQKKHYMILSYLLLSIIILLICVYCKMY